MREEGCARRPARRGVAADHGLDRRDELGGGQRRGGGGAADGGRRADRADAKIGDEDGAVVVVGHPPQQPEVRQ